MNQLYAALVDHYYAQKMGIKSANSPEQMTAHIYNTFYEEMLRDGQFSGEQLHKIANEDPQKYAESVDIWLAAPLEEAQKHASNLVSADIFSGRVAAQIEAMIPQIATKVASAVMEKIAEGGDEPAQGMAERLRSAASRTYESAKGRVGDAVDYAKNNKLKATGYAAGAVGGLAAAGYGAKKLHGAWKARKERQAEAANAPSTPPAEANKAASWLKAANDPNLEGMILDRASALENEYNLVGQFDIPQSTGNETLDFVNHNAAVLVAEANDLILRSV